MNDKVNFCEAFSTTPQGFNKYKTREFCLLTFLISNFRKVDKINDNEMTFLVIML